jgi:uroporphyrinogen decarboxylase
MTQVNYSECMKTALEGGKPAGTVPLWELHFHCWDQAAGEPIVVGRAFEQLPASEQDKALDRNAHLMAKVAERLHFAAITIPDGFWETAPGVPSYYWLPAEARYKLAEHLVRLVGDRIMIVASVGGVMGMPGPADYLEFSYKLVDVPDEVDEIARRTYASGIATAKRMRDVGVEAVYTAGDLADNHGSYYKPKYMQRFVLPYLHKWAEEVKGMGLYAILHTDGNIKLILEDLITSGIHALQAIDPVAGMDIRQVKQQVNGRICLCGNLDCGLLYSGPSEAIFSTARDLLLDLQPDGAYVFGASNAVHYETPLKHYLKMTEAWEKYGYETSSDDQSGQN